MVAVVAFATSAVADLAVLLDNLGTYSVDSHMAAPRRRAAARRSAGARHLAASSTTCCTTTAYVTFAKEPLTYVRLRQTASSLL